VLRFRACRYHSCRKIVRKLAFGAKKWRGAGTLRRGDFSLVFGARAGRFYQRMPGLLAKAGKRGKTPPRFALAGGLHRSKKIFLLASRVTGVRGGVGFFFFLALDVRKSKNSFCL